jgi:subtilisin family serine protease
VLILDTGLATQPSEAGRIPANERLRDHAVVHSDWTDANALAAVPIDVSRTDEDEKGVDGDGHLDRQAGHGTFIAGIIRRHAPDAKILTQGVISSFGDGDDWDISAGLAEALDRDRVDVVNMSLGCYTDDDLPPLTPEGLPVLSDAIARARNQGAVVVAAAGNNGSCRKFWPAALDGVISVGATFCGTRAWFSNFGPWVTACAPGVDVISTFFEHSGPASSVAGIDPDEYAGWAMWSGTSFAAPQVAAAIARIMCEIGGTADQAASVVLRSGVEVEDLGIHIVAEEEEVLQA